MNSESGIELNAPARIKGWISGGGATVELLARCENNDVGTVLAVTLRPNPRGNVYDFDYHRKKSALRTGGIVLLRRLVIEGEAAATIKSMDVLMENDKVGPAYVVQGAAVSLLPPPPGSKSAYVEQAIVAMPSERIEIRSIQDGAKRIRSGLEQAAIFGKPGLILTGELKNGNVAESLLGSEIDLTIDEVISSLLHNTDAELVAEVKSAKIKWHLVPFFRADVDPEMTKISAQRLNLDYGNGDDEFGWTRSNVVMRAYGTEWIIIDTAVISDTEDNEAGLLIDIVEA
ncbi:hypothetical protein G6L37_04035 [Agrobacterium rubi]|nr:hypothetical protein [Agrobacterium rubi]NTF24520.1 hypothetical protein [Agrobacterium rubi]